MIVFCDICQELLRPSDTIFTINCGHVFHYDCLTQWLDRSPTCPHCRQVATPDTIHKIYFTFANDTETEDLPLETQVNNLKFKILLREKDINYYTTKSQTLEKQNTNLRQEIRKVERELSQKNSMICDLKDQMARFKQTRLNYEILKKKLSAKKQELQDYKQHTHKYLLMCDKSKDECPCIHIGVAEFLNNNNDKSDIDIRSGQNHSKSSDNKKKLTEKTLHLLKKGQSDRKKETGNQNDSRTKTEIVTFRNLIQEGRNVTREECPIIKKKAKLFQ